MKLNSYIFISFDGVASIVDNCKNPLQKLQEVNYVSTMERLFSVLGRSIGNSVQCCGMCVLNA